MSGHAEGRLLATTAAHPVQQGAGRGRAGCAGERTRGGHNHGEGCGVEGDREGWARHRIEENEEQLLKTMEEAH